MEQYALVVGLLQQLFESWKQELSAWRFAVLMEHLMNPEVEVVLVVAGDGLQLYRDAHAQPHSETFWKSLAAAAQPVLIKGIRPFQLEVKEVVTERGHVFFQQITRPGVKAVSRTLYFVVDNDYEVSLFLRTFSPIKSVTVREAVAR